MSGTVGGSGVYMSPVGAASVPASSGSSQISPLGMAMMGYGMGGMGGMPQMGSVPSQVPLGSMGTLMGGGGGDMASSGTPPWLTGQAPIPQNVLATATSPNWMQGVMPEGLRQQTLAQQGVINIPTNDPSGGQ